MRQQLNLFGFAAGIAGNNPDCALAPWFLYYHPEWFHRVSLTISWEAFIKASSHLFGASVMPEVMEIVKNLSEAVLPFAREQKPITVIGGDHSCAMGTWSAIAHANRAQGDIGLLWIDAHMDSHTPSTSLSQNAHGMPLAALLGHGEPGLCRLLDDQPKLKPQNVCLVGVRSYEEPERLLLEALGVRIYYMEEVTQRGLRTVIHEAYDQITAQTCGVGFSIDMDAIDPEDAPGVGYREPGGLKGQELREALSSLPKNRNRLLGVELTEYNPIVDIDNKTAYLLIELLNAVL